MNMMIYVVSVTLFWIVDSYINDMTKIIIQLRHSVSIGIFKIRYAIDVIIKYDKYVIVKIVLLQ